MAFLMHDEHQDSSESEHEQDSSRRRRRTSSPSQSASKKARYSPSAVEHNANSNGDSKPTSASEPLSLSILGVEPLDEFIREVADWIHGLIMSRPDLGGHVEVEGKVGLLKYKDGNHRLNYPIRVETILMGGDDHKFESNMSAAQHKHFNQLLNSLEASSRLPSHPTSPLRYTHTKLVDTFYGGDSRDGKIRVTRDEKTGEVKECMRKVRLGDLEVFSPKRHADWRISVNVEIPATHPVGTASLTRRKDRMSYSHEEFSIDLTQVNQTTSPGSPPQIMHELEVEFARPTLLMSTAATRMDPGASQRDRDAFDELVRAFVNNMRVLVRNALPP
ncbi:mRNA capping enzyme [Rickenella mellea]|uniref:mRNA-capping enzyme subunit beta n=1 Tax=Rickenella mellea TaxID=50990 RepID=A0A4Y7Q4G3_9AGAM|nr:mRNA capping enzyme [Rickenella mellea]